jgi:hypothetical protein
MRTHPEDFVHFLEDTGHGQQHALDSYLSTMSRDGEWGDNLTLQALCSVYKVHIFVLKMGGQIGPDGYWTEVGQAEGAVSTFWLHLRDNHYENLVSLRQIRLP